MLTANLKGLPHTVETLYLTLPGIALWNASKSFETEKIHFGWGLTNGCQCFKPQVSAFNTCSAVDGHL